MPNRSIVVYGNCQGYVLYDFLRQSPAFKDNYNIFYHFVTMEETQREEWQKQIDNADVILAQDVQDWQHYPFREQAESKILVRYPLVTFTSLWPFDSAQGQRDEVAAVGNQTIPQHLKFDYHDALLAKLRSEVPDQEDRYQAYKSLSYGRPLNFRRLLQAEAIRIQAIDKKFNLELYDYIFTNLEKKRIFHTVTHPTAELIEQLAASACKLAGLPYSFSINDVPDQAAGYQVPIHPRLIADLNIQWANHDTRYNFRWQPLTFEAYYRGYIFTYG